MTRQACPNDKRAFLITLTAKGKQKIDQALPHHIQRVETFFARLTAEEQGELIRILKKFKD
ncbi:Transcriptional regulator, MarR family [Streptococcus sp. DD12]|nr:Transcriptional regulator, MarR family [Streptococcus sp. DD12]